jgi:hypothetical protein
MEKLTVTFERNRDEDSNKVFVHVRGANDKTSISLHHTITFSDFQRVLDLVVPSLVEEK